MNDSVLQTRKMIAETLNKLEPTVTVTEKGSYLLTAEVEDGKTIEVEAFMMDTAALFLKMKHEMYLRDWAKKSQERIAKGEEISD